MALEIEIKLRVTEHASIRTRLQELGATFNGARLETNTFLDTPDERLIKSGSGLRVRRHRDLKTNEVTAVITHKGPKHPGELKVREETEIGVSSYAEAIKLLEALGYEVRLSFEKRREIWDLGECEVVLDELPENLGLFVEIEGESEKAVREVRAQLGLSNAPIEPAGYAVLIARHLQKSGRSVITFQS